MPSKGTWTNRFVGKHANGLRGLVYKKATRQGDEKAKVYYPIISSAIKRFKELKRAGDPDYAKKSWGTLDVEAWFELKKFYPGPASEYEAEYFYLRAGKKLYVMDDLSLSDRPDYSKEQIRATVNTTRQELKDYEGPAYNIDIPTDISDFGTDGKPVDGRAWAWGETPNRSLRQDVEWASEWALRSDLDRSKIPSGRALFLLSYCRAQPVAFANSLLSKFIPTAARVAQEEEMMQQDQFVFDMVANACNAITKSKHVDNDVAMRDELIVEEIGEGYLE